MGGVITAVVTPTITGQMDREILMINLCAVGDYVIEYNEGIVVTPEHDKHSLTPSQMGVLSVIASASPNIVSSETIVNTVWPTGHRSDDALKKSIHFLRKTFSDDARNPWFIETVRGRGYRCIADVQFQKRPNPDAASSAARLDEPPKILNVFGVAITISLNIDTACESKTLFLLIAGALDQARKIVDKRGHHTLATCEDCFRVLIYQNQNPVQEALLTCHEIMRHTANFLEQAISELDIRTGISYSEISILKHENHAAPSASGKAISRSAEIATKSPSKHISICSNSINLLPEDYTAKRKDIQGTTFYTISRNGPEASNNTPALIGRHQQLNQLTSIREAARVGQTQKVFISGDAGIGKSHLARAFRFTLSNYEKKPLEIISFVQSEENEPFSEIIAYILRSILPERNRESKALTRRIAELCETLNLIDINSLNVVNGLLTSSPDLSSSPKHVVPKELRAEIINEFLMRYFAYISEQTILIFDDIHWADSDSLSLVKRLLSLLDSENCLVVLLSRFSAEHSGMASLVNHRIHLNGIEPSQCRQLMGEYSPQGLIEETFANDVHSYTNGNPLHIIEISKSINANSRKNNSIPLEKLYLNQSKQLNIGQDVLQIASVIGEVFSREILIEACNAQSIMDIDSQITQLAQHDIIYEYQSYPKKSYKFKHDLARKAIYEAIDKNLAIRLHRLLAKIYKQKSSENTVSIIARHYMEAEEYLSAAEHWFVAGQQSLQNMFEESKQHIELALECIAETTVSQERDELEIKIRTIYGPILMAANGYHDASIEKNAKLLELLLSIQSNPNHEGLAQAYMALWTNKIVNAQIFTALKVANKIVDIANNMKDPNHDVLMEGKVAIGVTQLHVGMTQEGIENLLEASNLYNATHHRGHKYIYGQDPAMAAHIYAGIGFALLGEHKQSLDHTRQGLAYAKQSDHPNTECFALSIAAKTASILADYDLAHIRAQESLKLAEDNNLEIWKHMNLFSIKLYEYKTRPSVDTVDDLLEINELEHSKRNLVNHHDQLIDIILAYTEMGKKEKAVKLIKRVITEDERRACKVEHPHLDIIAKQFEISI